MMDKAKGVTPTERMLAEFCERSFLKLWSYPNPFKDDGHELCDLLAVFGDYVFIFFDREKPLPETSDKDPQVVWERWKRTVIDDQTRTAHGAERYLRSGRQIFVDAKRTVTFPIPFDRTNAIVHKIIVAHGAKEACERASPDNIYGSLAITYAEVDGSEDPSQPFHIRLDRTNIVHILDSHNLPIVLRELDTVYDFARFLDEKTRAVGAYKSLSYCGEEDLLAHYYLNFDGDAQRYVIGPAASEDIDGVFIEEGSWHDFIRTPIYNNTKIEDQISYFWDDLIQRTCQNSLDGTLGGNSNIERGESAIFEMVKEPRFMRRSLSQRMLAAVEQFPKTEHSFRMVSFIPSFEPTTGYVLLQARPPASMRGHPDNRAVRQTMLELACGAAKNKFPQMKKIVGIGIDPPIPPDNEIAEDFILMPCEAWPPAVQLEYEEANREMRFFATSSLREHQERVTQFVPPSRQASQAAFPKVGRNDPCPCGSGKKFKKCHLAD
jgi:hypothetical protein